MGITWSELTISADGVGIDDLLSEWRWLVGDEDFQPVVISALGDLFLGSKDGRVFWLNAGWGEFMEVAQDGAEFKNLMVQPGNTDEWFAPQLIVQLLNACGALERHQCFSFKIPPKLGGTFDADNFEPTNLSVHFGILGQIHRQIKDLPEGTPIGEFSTE